MSVFHQFNGNTQMQAVVSGMSAVRRCTRKLKIESESKRDLRALLRRSFLKVLYIWPLWPWMWVKVIEFNKLGSTSSKHATGQLSVAMAFWLVKRSFLNILKTFDPCDLESTSRSFILTNFVALHPSMLQAKYEFPGPYSYWEEVS